MSAVSCMTDIIMGGVGNHFIFIRLFFGPPPKNNPDNSGYTQSLAEL